MAISAKGVKDSTGSTRWSAGTPCRAAGVQDLGAPDQLQQQYPGTTNSNVQDTFYVLEAPSGFSCVTRRKKCGLGPERPTRCVRGRPHLVTNAGDGSATFLVLQGIASTTTSR